MADYSTGGSLGGSSVDPTQLLRLMQQPRPQYTAGDWAALGASAADPFGVPSALAARAGYPQWQNLEAAHPDPSTAGSFLTPGAVTSLPFKGVAALGRLARAYPKVAGGLAATAAVASPAAAGDQPVGRPDFSAEDQERLKQLQATIDQAHKDKSTFISSKKYGSLPLSAKNAQNATYDSTAANAQAEMDRMRTGMSQQQADYDKAGQPFSVRDPGDADLMRKGALGYALGHGYLRGVMGKNPFLTPLYGAGEALAGAYAPTLLDVLKPAGTAASNLAQNNIWNTDYWKHAVAPDVLGGALLSGAVGHPSGHLTSDIAKSAGRGIAAAYNFFKGGANAGTLAASAPQAETAAPPAFADRKFLTKDLVPLGNGRYKVPKGDPYGHGGRFVSNANVTDLPTSSTP